MKDIEMISAIITGQGQLPSSYIQFRIHACKDSLEKNQLHLHQEILNSYQAIRSPLYRHLLAGVKSLCPN